MAEFALGLTKTAVEGTLIRVKSAIEEEAAVKEQLQEDLEFITGEFEMMQSFLTGANAADRAAKNQVVRTWVRQLRDLAFDVENCVDFVIHLDSPPWTNWLWRVVPSLCKAGTPLLPLDEAAAEIKRLKSRVVDVSQRNTRYNLMTDSTAMADQHMMPTAAASSSSAAAAAFHILREVWRAAGKLHRSDTTLKDLMTDAVGDELQVVSLWPGSQSACADLHLSEVSCLIREAYTDPEICSEFECRAWVKLTLSHPAAAFNTQEFLNSLMAQLDNQLAAAADGKAELMQQVNTKKYLVVIQGISSVAEWDAIKMYLPDNNNGSRIIVSTQHMRTALVCTGDPYKVLELARFSDGQTLFAFSKVPMIRKHVGEFIWQIGHGGVISVLGGRVRTWDKIGQLYKLVMYKHKDIDGVLAFKEQSWVNVPDPFDLEAFYVQLFLNFQPCDFQAKEITAVGLGGVAKRCRRYIAEGGCLVIINGLQSKKHWDMIKETLVLSNEPVAPKGNSIIVITEEVSVATYCANQRNRCLQTKDVDCSMPLRGLLGDSKRCGIVGKENFCRARLLYPDPDGALDLDDLLCLNREYELPALELQIRKPGVISVWGHPGDGKSVTVKNAYYKQTVVLKSYEFCSWVALPDRPFDLTDFSWHLFLGFFSCCVKDKELQAVALLRGENPPIQKCCQILRRYKCLVVIDGLRSESDWEEIKANFLSSQPATLHGCIVVITNEERVARHCVLDEQQGRVIHYKPHPLTKAASCRTYKRGEDASGWTAELDLVGRDKETDKLHYVLARTTSVFSLWGVSGVGKSALVRDAYYGRIRMLKISDRSTKHSWVDVPDPFDLSEFFHRLLLGFHSNDLQAKEVAAVSIMRGHDTVHGCCKIMRENECLIIIDGLRSTHDWDLIRAAFLSETDHGSNVIVITNEESTATYCVHDKTNVLNVKSLNAKDALLLFREITWRGQQKLTPIEKKFSEAILAKCGGLPKVIAAIGEYSRKSFLFEGTTYDENLRYISRKIHHDFMGMLVTDPDPEFKSLRGLFRWMQSYFDACPDSLKPCIFYLSVFPVGRNIRRRRLLRRWIAEGYSTDASPGVTAEDNAEMLFGELVKLSIIQEQKKTPSNSSNKKKNSIQVNGFYHGYIMSRPMEDNLVFALDEHCSINSRRVGQHLTIRSSWDRDEAVYQSLNFTRLRSLTVFGKWMPFFISTDVNMRVLRALDLEDTTEGVTDDVLEQIGKLLPRLKFLSLRGCKQITRIPDSFGGFRQLQTLDVRNTKIVTLPHAIVKLVKLQYLRAGTTHEPLDEGYHASDCDDTREPPVVAGDVGMSSEQAAAAGAETSTSQLPVAAEDDGMITGLPTIADTSSRRQPAADEDRASTTRPPWRSNARNVVASYSCRLLSKKKWRARRQIHDNNGNFSVEIPAAAIGNLTALHTLGVVDVSGARGKAILEELKKLTQLRKLGVSGINRENVQDLGCAISGHGHLESLSVHLDEEEEIASFFSYSHDMFSDLPKTLKSLKLYTGDGHGNVQVSPVLIKKLDNVNNLRKVNLELTVSTQEDIDGLMELPHKGVFRHLCVKPIQDGVLHFDYRLGDIVGGYNCTVFKIDCSCYKLTVTFGPRKTYHVEVLVIHCSTPASSLLLAGLESLCHLTEVCLAGSYSEAVRQHLEEKVAQFNRRQRSRVVLKLLDQPRSS